AAARSARISACAVGSESSITRFPARARISPPRTTTAPTGTSPRAPAVSASANASSRNGLDAPVMVARASLASGTEDDLDGARIRFVGCAQAAADHARGNAARRQPFHCPVGAAEGQHLAVARTLPVVISEDADRAFFLG